MSRKSPFHREGNGAIDRSDLELNNDNLMIIKTIIIIIMITIITIRLIIIVIITVL